jgi:hypothetical protein
MAMMMRSIQVLDRLHAGIVHYVWMLAFTRRACVCSLGIEFGGRVWNALLYCIVGLVWLSFDSIDLGIVSLPFTLWGLARSVGACSFPCFLFDFESGLRDINAMESRDTVYAFEGFFLDDNSWSLQRFEVLRTGLSDR